MKKLLTEENKGFTLIELLVVIAIIGILASIVLVSLAGARDRARDARIQADMNQIRSTAELENSADGDYDDIECTDLTVPTCDTTDMTTLVNDINNQGGTSLTQLAGDGGVVEATPWDGVDAYCMYVKLNNGNWCCIDSSLRANCDHPDKPNADNECLDDATPTFVCPAAGT